MLSAFSRSWLAAGFALALLASPAQAFQINQPPELERLLRLLLQQARDGQCSAQMSPLLAVSCEEQIAFLSRRLQAMGPVSGVAFRGYEQSSGGAGVFIVAFANGRQTWMIRQDASGRVNFFWTPGY